MGTVKKGDKTMSKMHEYLGTKATSLAPYGYQKEIAIYIKEKIKRER